MATFPINNAPFEMNMAELQSVYDDARGPARSCRFAVVINRPRIFNTITSSVVSTNILNDLTYLCEATEMPGRRVDTVDLRYYGPNFKMPYQPVYDDLSMIFVCRNDQREREFFDDWMEAINPSDTYNFNYKDEYSTTISLFHFDDEGIPSYAYTIYEAYPIFVNPQPVTWVDDNYQRLTVNFTYMNWRRLNKDAPYKSVDKLVRNGAESKPFPIRTIF